MKILSIHAGGHDASAGAFEGYDLKAAIQSERMTRKKGQGGYPDQAIDEVLDIAGWQRSDIDLVNISRSNIQRKYVNFTGLNRIFNAYSTKVRGKEYIAISRLLRKLKAKDFSSLFNKEDFIKDYGLRDDVEFFFHNHHLAHALSAFFFTNWDNALLYTADGHGDNVQYSARIFQDKKLDCIFGGEENLLKPQSCDSIAMAYAYATEALGYKSFRHEGKLTGLAAYGKPTIADAIAERFTVEANGQITSDFQNNTLMRRFIISTSTTNKPEDVAASIQKVLEDKILESVKTILKKHPVEHLALAGGIFANVRLNKLLKDETGVKEIFICPAMGDEGMVIGGPLHYLLERDGIDTFLKKRRILKDVYLGRDYNQDIDATLIANKNIKRTSKDSVKQTAELLANGNVGAIYSGRMEYGPRALGARSIIGSPADVSINDTLNKRLTRTEFMPFAPYVLKEDASKVFDIDDSNSYACRFMTITTNVKEAWREKIPGVVHIDGTARPQIIDKKSNPLYHDILKAFKKKTKLPVLINTSFNAHEEPIINTPEECLKALLDNRIDFIVTEQGIYTGKQNAQDA